VRSQLIEIYSHRNSVRLVDRDLYQYATAEAHLNQGQSLEVLQDWCSDTYPAVLASVSLAARLGGAKQCWNCRLYVMQRDYIGGPGPLLASGGSPGRVGPFAGLVA